MCNIGEDPIHLVADLLVESGEWDKEKIKRTFIAPDVNTILNMPRPRVAMEDYWAWGNERSGIFTVCSAYRMLMESREEGMGQIGSSTQGQEVWKALWCLNVQPKIHVFWCRTLQGFLPAKGKLFRRHIGKDDVCPLCGQTVLERSRGVL